MVKKTVVIALIGLMSLSAQAGEGLERLKKFTRSLQSMQADFKQTLFDDKMRQVEVSSGTFVLEKPGKFRWDYKKPYEQHIIADGNKVWLYDPELEQVTVRAMEDALGAAPIALLTSNQNIEDQFKVIELGNFDGRQLVQLELKVKDTDFGFMLLALGDKGLDTMELKDKLGQVTRIEFNKTEINKEIDDGLFAFNVPKGVDVIGE